MPDEKEAMGLTDDELETLAEKVSEKLGKTLARNFYQELGEGVWGLAKKALLVAIVIAAYLGAKSDFSWLKIWK